MPVFKVRNRMLNVRLSDDEYEELTRLAVAKGAHSTSDLARQALAEFVARESQANGSSEVSSRIAQLEAEVRRLSRILDTLAAAARQQT
ncbi:MAG: ribbon-helix-helix protein, CopG family [Bryobacteraceae bacterium]